MTKKANRIDLYLFIKQTHEYSNTKYTIFQWKLKSCCCRNQFRDHCIRSIILFKRIFWRVWAIDYIHSIFHSQSTPSFVFLLHLKCPFVVSLKRPIRPLISNKTLLKFSNEVLLLHSVVSRKHLHLACTAKQ